MPSRYNTYNSQRKISAGGKRPMEKSGKHGSVVVKQGCCSVGLPGKASSNFAAAKKGYRKVQSNAQSMGI